ncbi:MAG: CHASE2 domain-containing protein, partial [Planctomycetota bacterium]
MITASGSRRTTAALLAASFVGAHLCFLVLPGAFEPWNLRATDVLFRLRASLGWGAPRYDPTVAYVELSDQSFRELSSPYVDRSHYAAVIRNLGSMETALQVQDVVFKAPAGAERDRALIEATGEARNVIFALVAGMAGRGVAARPDLPPDPEPWAVEVDGDAGAFSVSVRPEPGLAKLAARARGLGFIDLEADRDGVFRRAPLLVRAGGGFYPSLGLRAACAYLGVSPDRIAVRPGVSVTLRGARRPGEETGRDIVIPIDARGRMRVNFVGPWRAMDHYSFADVYSAGDDPDEIDLLRDRLGGRIVVVVDVSTAAKDAGPTPLEAYSPLPGIHANVLHSILTEQFVRELSTPGMVGIELALLGLVYVLARRPSSRVFLTGTVGLLAAFLAVSTGLFVSAGLILHLARPLLMGIAGVAATFGHRYLQEERQKATLRGSFEAYFPPPLVERIMADPDRLAVGGRRKELTVLFSDIQGFTARTASMAPAEVQELLNEYFEAMVEVVFRHGGTLDKFIGDGLMVFFGDPEPQADHALRCVRAAVEMQARLGELNRSWRARGREPVEIRIGVNTGPMVVGNMGSPLRLSYTVLGAAVNLAQRLEAKAPAGGILISQSTRDAVGDRVPIRPVGTIPAKGFPEPVPAHRVVWDAEAGGPAEA